VAEPASFNQTAQERPARDSLGRPDCGFSRQTFPARREQAQRHGRRCCAQHCDV